MTKTPEEMAIEWEQQEPECGLKRNGFLAGYQAAKEEDKAKMQELEANWKFCCEDKARLLNELAVAERAKDQLADAGKVMFCVHCNDMHKGDCAEGKGKNHAALRGTQWISVKERLPEENDEVLIYTEGKYIYMARIYKGNEAYPISNGCGCCGSEERYTHWMPLPEPPEK